MLQELKSKVISDITKENQDIIYQVKNIILEEVINKNVNPVLGYTWSGKSTSAENEQRQKEHILNFFKNLFIFEGSEKLIYDLEMPTVLKLKNNYFDINIDINLIRKKDDLFCTYVIPYDIEQYYSEVVFYEMEIPCLDEDSNSKLMLTDITFLGHSTISDFMDIRIYTDNTYSFTLPGNQNKDILDFIMKNFENDSKEFADFLVLTNDFNINEKSPLSLLYNTLINLKNINNKIDLKLDKKNGL